MKLVRFGSKGNEKAGIRADDGLYDVSGFGEDYDQKFLSGDGISRLAGWWRQNKSRCGKVPDNVRIGAPVKDPSKIICIGMNYADHAAETGAEAPEEPIIFFKSTSSIAGPGDDVIIPRGSIKTDWEVELAVVIGKRASYVAEEEAMDHVAGYCLHNDYSERAFQIERGGQWVKGKSCDTFAPLGPWLATKDEIADLDDLRLWLTVNGAMMQDGNTVNMIFKVPFLISYISRFMSLLPGDIISTGTPAGVGLGMQPQRFLRVGDRVACGIDGLGEGRQTLKDWSNKEMR